MSRRRCHVPSEVRAGDLRNCRSEALTGDNQPRGRVWPGGSRAWAMLAPAGHGTGNGWSTTPGRCASALVDVERPRLSSWCCTRVASSWRPCSRYSCWAFRHTAQRMATSSPTVPAPTTRILNRARSRWMTSPPGRDSPHLGVGGGRGRPDGVVPMDAEPGAADADALRVAMTLVRGPMSLPTRSGRPPASYRRAASRRWWPRPTHGPGRCRTHRPRGPMDLDLSLKYVLGPSREGAPLDSVVFRQLTKFLI
jgi:hypothetical protein